MWRKSKVKYDALVNGEAKTQSEFYLHDAVSFGEVEAHCAEHLRSRIKNPDVDAVSKVRFADVLFFTMQEEDAFYEIKTVEFSDGKKYTYNYLLAALDTIEAEARLKERFKHTIIPWEVVAVKKPDIMAVWHPIINIWQGDWYNRMDRYYDEGKYEVGHNQMDLDFDTPADRADTDQPQPDPQRDHGHGDSKRR